MEEKNVEKKPTATNDGKMSRSFWKWSIIATIFIFPLGITLIIYGLAMNAMVTMKK